MDIKEFARLGGLARAKKLGKRALKEHAHKMVFARKLKRIKRNAKNGLIYDV